MIIGPSWLMLSVNEILVENAPQVFFSYFEIAVVGNAGIWDLVIALAYTWHWGAKCEIGRDIQFLQRSMTNLTLVHTQALHAKLVNQWVSIYAGIVCKHWHSMFEAETWRKGAQGVTRLRGNNTAMAEHLLDQPTSPFVKSCRTLG